MRLVRTNLAIAVLFFVAVVIHADDTATPRTGFFEVVMTPVEVLGEAGAQSVADILAAEERIGWQLYVPDNMAGTVSWGDKVPPKIELIKQNYHVFMVGTYDPALQDTQRVYNDYLDAGVENSRLITIRNHRHSMPPREFFAKALAYLDSRPGERD